MEVEELQLQDRRGNSYSISSFDLFWLNWQTKRTKLAAKDFEMSEFHQDTWNCYLMLGFVSAHISWNAIFNLETRWTYNALRSDLLLQPTWTLRKICWREYSPTVNAIKNQSPSQNHVSLALGRWTSTNKLDITSVIVFDMDRNWVLGEVQLVSNECDRLFFSVFER